jgi:hypothetical protein
MPETSAVRTQTRRVKMKALNAIEAILDAPDSVPKDKYLELLFKIAGNVIPRTQEITGEDGEAINVNLVKYADNSITIPIPTEGVSATVT